MTLKERTTTGPSAIGVAFRPATTTTPVPTLQAADFPALAAAEPVVHPARVNCDAL